MIKKSLYQIGINRSFIIYLYKKYTCKLKYKQPRSHIICQNTSIHCHTYKESTMQTMEPSNFTIAFGQGKPEAPVGDNIQQVVTAVSPDDVLKQQSQAHLKKNEKINKNTKPKVETKPKAKRSLKTKGTDVQTQRLANAYMVWCRSERKKILKENPDMKASEISKLLGTRWNALPQEVRYYYIEEANRLRALQRKEYPNYKCMTKKKPTQNVQFRVPIPRPIAQQWFDRVSELDDTRMTCFFKNYNYIKSHRPDVQMPLAIHLSYSCCLDMRDVKDYLSNN